MSEYLDIPGIDVMLGLGSELQHRGEDLASSMSSAIAAVQGLENDPGTFPADEFTNAFLDTLKSGGQGKPANEVVADSALRVGQTLADLGQYVVDAMQGYQSADAQNAAAVHNAI